MHRLCQLLLVGGLLAAVSLSTDAQMRVAPLDMSQGHVALGLAIRHLGNTGIFMQATAHPDDENNGLLVMLNRGQGYRTVLATATRGNGGQNEIGPEIFEALGVLRTEELAALHRFDGAEQYFTRAVDFGFSFSIEETFQKWGRQEILGDFVRLIRMTRPDVVTGLPPEGAGGGQHHQASAIIAREAVKSAGDPAQFPEQLKDGLRPWQPRKFYFTGQFGGPNEAARTNEPGQLAVNLAVYDPLLGRTYWEIGTEARSMHKCQGMAQLLSLPGPIATNYRLADSTIPGQLGRDEQTLFDGIDTTVPGLARFAGPAPARELVDGLTSIAAAAQDAEQTFAKESDAATVRPLVAGLRAVRALRGQLPRLVADEGGRYEIGTRLAQKASEFEQAILLANSVRLEVLADDGVVVAGQSLRVSVIAANRGAADVTVTQVQFDGFEGDQPCELTAVSAGNAYGIMAGGGRGRGGAQRAAAPISTLQTHQVGQCTPILAVPATARLSEPYWHRAGDAGRYTFDADAPFGLPYRPTPFAARITLTTSTGDEIVRVEPVQYRYEGNIFSGEKRSELLVVPALSVRVSPQVAIIPSTASSGATSGATPARRTSTSARGSAATALPAGREVRVTVLNASKSATDTTVRLALPVGWTATPAEQPLRFSREDESQTVRFEIRAPAGAGARDYSVKVSASAAGASFARGYQVIEYPHIRRQHIYHDADITLKVVDVRTASNLKVGYVMGVGDEVPAAIEQLGVKVEFLGPDDLAWGDLSRFDTIVTGVRAYERREDLRANNGRLLDYVKNGGTLLVQYNKFEFNQAQFGPYPARVSADRVTEETAPVRILAPENPIFSLPNRISDRTWQAWVQERGLYFLGERDTQYVDLVELEDPFPYNPGPKRGALVETTYGKGRWIYVGLGLWRELPAGVDGAYQLLANLISRGKL